jgi:hypothetical protein
MWASILSSLHKIIGGILQKKSVLVKAAYFSTNCNDWLNVELSQRSMANGFMGIVNQRLFWEKPSLRFMLYVIFAKDIFFSNLLLAPIGILGDDLVDFPGRPDESIFKLSNQPCQQNDEWQNLFGAFSGEEGLYIQAWHSWTVLSKMGFSGYELGLTGYWIFYQHFKDRPQGTKKQEKYMVREVEGVDYFFWFGFSWIYKNVGFTNRACSTPDKIVVCFAHTIYPYSAISLLKMTYRNADCFHLPFFWILWRLNTASALIARSPFATQPYPEARLYGEVFSIREQKVNLYLRTCLTFSALYPFDGPIAYHSLKLM